MFGELVMVEVPDVFVLHNGVNNFMHYFEVVLEMSMALNEELLYLIKVINTAKAHL